MNLLRNLPARAAVLLALLAAGLACGLPSRPALNPSPALPLQTLPALASPTPFLPPPAAPTPSAPPPAPAGAYRPIFEPADCVFAVPPGQEARCGYLVVPENRAQPDGPVVRLHVAVFPARNPAVQDPVVYLSGGPGSSALELAGYLFRHRLGAVLERGDLLFFDQRGTGYSQPRLDCPERQELNSDLLDQRPPPVDASRLIVDAFRRCHERLLKEGIDLNSYNSAASAADVNDLRLALGYPRLNLYAVSYGTRLALTIMRDYPEALRSAVLDSTYPPQENLYTALAPNAERSFNRLFETCAADSGCNSAFPDLREVFYNLVDQLNAAPLRVSLRAAGNEHQVSLDGGLLIDVLFVGMYNPAVIAEMPAMIYAIRRGDTAILRERLALYFEDSSALGMNMAVQCAEEIPFNTEQDVVDAARGVQPQIAAFFPASVAPLFTACREWHPDPPDPRENQPVHSAVPALLLAGDLDPITPPEWGRATAGGLSNAYFFEYSASGHWVTRSSACALQMALDFWADPSHAPDSTCLSSQPGIQFIY